MGLLLKFLAIIGLLFWAYRLLQIIAKWRYRNAIEKTIWLVVIAGGVWWCVSTLVG